MALDKDKKAFKGMMPKWITVIVISRDLIVVTGCLMLYFVTDKLIIEPSTFGKAANALQYLLIGFTLFSINIKGESVIPVSFLVLIAVLTAISGLQYVYKGLKIASTESL